MKFTRLKLLVFALSFMTGGTAQAGLPAMPEIPVTLPDSVRQPLIVKRQPLALRKQSLLDEGKLLNQQCTDIVSGSPQHQACLDRQKTFNAKVEILRTDMDALEDEIDAAVDTDNKRLAAINRDPKESEFFYAQQTRTLTPMQDGGHPLDAPGSPPVGLHGLVGGTTWTFGFKWPHKECNTKCMEDVERNLASQLKLFCSSQSKPEQCVRNGLPFTKESYDMVVSMGSAHSAIEDLATRVLWDGSSFGEYSRQNQEIFASLKGRQFDSLDCHSNGAMLCLAALRSGDTTAKTVRLFGPQINAEAAARWREWADNTGGKIEIYINKGDPVPALSWKQPTPQTAVEKADTAAWLTNPITGPATIAEALMFTWTDSQSATMDGILGGYGLKVMKRPECESSPEKCHSMLLYEKNTGILPVKH